jgi:hypothetical protein
MLKLYKDPKSGMIPWPAEWAAYIHYNGGTNVPCDMLIGPCACGAWHTETEDWVQEYLAKYKAIIIGTDKLDDYPEFDYETILERYNVKVAWWDQSVDLAGNIYNDPPDLCGWGFSDKHGFIFIGRVTEEIARKAAAIWTALWYRGVSASLCCRLMEGYIGHLEAQENKRLTFLVEYAHAQDCDKHCLRFTREGFCTDSRMALTLQHRILNHLGPVAEDEEIICTFTKRKVV